jgi:hypothetical protein
MKAHQTLFVIASSNSMAMFKNAIGYTLSVSQSMAIESFVCIKVTYSIKVKIRASIKNIHRQRRSGAIKFLIPFFDYALRLSPFTNDWYEVFNK